MIWNKLPSWKIDFSNCLQREQFWIERKLRKRKTRFGVVSRCAIRKQIVMKALVLVGCSTCGLKHWNRIALINVYKIWDSVQSWSDWSSRKTLSLKLPTFEQYVYIPTTLCILHRVNVVSGYRKWKKCTESPKYHKHGQMVLIQYSE